MRIGRLSLIMRDAETSFGNIIGGSAELSYALKGTLISNMAFIIPLTEFATENTLDVGINQVVTERFGIVVAIANDSADTERLGMVAYDQLHEIRNELFGAFLNKNIPEAETPITYRGGKLIAINGAYLWYQFEFEYQSRLNDDGLEEREVDDEQVLSLWNTIYANVIPAPSTELPYEGDLPLPDGYPDVTIPDIAWFVDLTADPADGQFNTGFATAFETYDTDRRPS